MLVQHGLKEDRWYELLGKVKLGLNICFLGFYQIFTLLSGLWVVVALTNGIEVQLSGNVPAAHKFVPMQHHLVDSVC